MTKFGTLLTILLCVIGSVFSVRAADRNLFPLITSFTASTLTPATGEVVTFTVSAFDEDGPTPTITIDYGDGTTGSELTHVYSIFGQYVANATASDGQLSDTRKLIIQVHDADFNRDGFIGPLDTNTDGDNYPDALELVLGTDPNNPKDPGLEGAGPSTHYSSTPPRPSAKFKKVRFDGALLSDQETIGKRLAVDVDGNPRIGVLDRRRSYKDADIRFKLAGKPKPNHFARFSLTITGEMLQRLIANSSKDAKGRPTRFTVHVLIDTLLNIESKTLKYSKPE